MVHVIVRIKYYADGIVLCGTRSEVVENKLEEWRMAMEDIGLKIKGKKTVYLRYNVDGNLDGDINLQGHNLERLNTFKYLGHGQKWRFGCGDDAYNTIRMYTLEEGIARDYVRPKNKFESQGESIQDSDCCKTSNDV